MFCILWQGFTLELHNSLDQPTTCNPPASASSIPENRQVLQNLARMCYKTVLSTIWAVFAEVYLRSLPTKQGSHRCRKYSSFCYTLHDVSEVSLCFPLSFLLTPHFPASPFVAGCILFFYVPPLNLFLTSGMRVSKNLHTRGSIRLPHCMP